MKWTLITATNNEAILKSCLLSSPEAASAARVILQRGYASAALAYDDAMQQADTDILVFAHQDVYLPAGWLASLEAAVAWLSQHDPNWAVLGSWGVAPSGKRAGHLYCTGLGKAMGAPFAAPVEVRTLDEFILVVRKSSGVRFDRDLPGYHMYGADICLEAERQAKKCYAISAFCIHNTNGYSLLPVEFWKSAWRIRRKWKSRLPILTPCVDITRGCWPMLRLHTVMMADAILRRCRPGQRVADPVALHQSMARPGGAPRLSTAG